MSRVQWLWDKGIEGIFANINEMTDWSGKKWNYPGETENPET